MEQINAQWVVASLVFQVSGSFAVELQSASAYPPKPSTGGCVVLCGVESDYKTVMEKLLAYDH